MLDTPKPKTVALVAYAGAQMSAVYGLADMFDVANRHGVAGAQHYVAHRIVTPDDLPPPDRFSAIVLPPNLGGHTGARDVVLHDWLRLAHAAGATLCSACAGAFWLAHAGLLDGRPATTHWGLEASFRQEFPKVLLQPQHLLLDDDQIVTAGGVMAWMDLGLHLIRRLLGPATVTQVCRHMLIDPPGREQRNYRVFTPRLDHGDVRILKLQRWMADHMAENLTIAALVRQSALSPRTLQRRFKQATGLSIRTYLQELRIEKARGLLEQTGLPVSEIGLAVGYEDQSAFARVFKTISGLNAGTYRKRFAVHSFGKREKT